MATTEHLSMSDVYMKEIAEMQKQNHHLLVRVKELTDEINLLREQLKEKK